MNSNKKTTTYLTIIIVILALIAIAILLESSQFNLLEYLIKLHGG
jgi:hypothetical protein